MKPTTRPGSAHILIVDDTPANLRLLDGMLSSLGYRNFLVTSGRQALAAARKEVPDLILLDIMMPGMDGFEVCREFKADPRLKDVPILFLSAVTNSDERVRAFREGGVDFISKPYNAAEVEARVRAHLLIHHQKREIEAAHEQLKELERLRDSLVHMVVHDMRTPLFVMELNLHSLHRAIPEADFANRTTLSDTVDKVRYLTSLVSQLLDVSQLEAGEMVLQKVPGNLASEVTRAVQTFKFSHPPIPVIADESVPALFDPAIIHRVVVNLIQNGLLHGGPDPRLRISVEKIGGGARVAVMDQGPGVPVEYQKTIFDKFSQVSNRNARKVGSGLGLAFCRLAIEAHGGAIGLGSTAGHGATFWFTLPGSPSILA